MQIASKETCFDAPVKPIGFRTPLAGATVIEDLEQYLPSLHRHAGTVAQDQDSADAYLGALLEILAVDASVLPEASSTKVGLFKLYTRLYANLFVRDRSAREGLTLPRNRQVLLLTLVEGVSTAETAAIVDASIAEVEDIVRFSGADARQAS